AREIDERSRVERLGVDDRRVDVGEDLEFARAADVVAVARRAVGDDLVAARLAHLTRLERFDHAGRLRHPADPFVGLDQHLSLLIARAGGSRYSGRRCLETWPRNP